VSSAAAAPARDSWRLARLLVLAALVIAGGAGAFLLTNLLQERTDGMTRYVRVDVWAVQQAEYAIQQFRATLARHVAGDPEVGVQALRDQLGRARSTVTLLRRAPGESGPERLIDVDAVARPAESALAQVAGLIGEGSGLRGDLALLRDTEATLAEPLRALRQLAVDSAQLRLALQDGDLESVRWLTGINRWMLAGFFAATALFILFLFGEMRAARRAERSATQSERRTRYLAEHDVLTGLPNRARFRDQLGEHLELARRDGRELWLHVLDLDGFKDVNDAFGHDVGDALLAAVADRLREAAGEGERLVRLGGDEFALYGTSPGDGQDAADRLLAAFALPIELLGRNLHVGTSIGVARFPADGRNVESLLKAADLALYAAKQERGRAARYDPEMTARQQRRRELEAALRQAIERNELEVHLQPQVRLADGRCIGAEALVRWQHPSLGRVSPADFIPIAESSGLIGPLGRWVLETACREALLWQGDAAEAVVAVNVSPSQFIYGDLVEETRSVLAATGLPARRLELEITEGMLMHDARSALDTLQRLRRLGVQLAIDDFGTGYSSLSYLKRFSVDKLKIDQSFVREMASDEDDRRIVATIVELARGLGLRTIAEGIETPEQRALLSALGCEEGQGYLFARPLPAEEFRSLELVTGQARLVTDDESLLRQVGT